MNTYVDNAMRLAARAHRTQVRKEADIPYISHPAMVALMLCRHGFSDTVIAAALTHDVLEDTDVPAEDLRAAIGNEAYAIVTEVTHEEGGAWKERKQRYIDTVRTVSDSAKAVATADKIHNAMSLLKAYEVQGQAIWAQFNAGRESKIWFEKAMLEMLQESWGHPLVDEYARYVSELEKLA